MPDEIEFQKLEKEYPDFFKKFPRKLIELANSEKTASQIAEVCLKNGVEDEEKIENIAYYITSVLLGSLPLGILSKALVTNLKIDTEAAEKISEEINRLIFSQVKDDLNGLSLPTKPPKPAPQTEGPKRPPSKDVYREKIE